MNPDELERFGAAFHPPASEAQLKELAKSLDCALPQDLRALYLHHNGMSERGDLPFRLMTTKEVAKTYRKFRGEEFVSEAIRFFWTDDESNYAALYVSGPAAGRVCVFDHEEADFSPLFRSLGSFYQALIEAAARGQDAYEMLETPGGQEPEGTPEEQAADLALAGLFFALHAAEVDPDIRQRHAFAGMQLLPKSESHRLLEWLRAEDMWVQERACTLLGRRGYTAAIPALAEVARSGKHNGRVAALLALRDFGAAAGQEVAQLRKELEPQWLIYLQPR